MFEISTQCRGQGRGSFVYPDSRWLRTASRNTVSISGTYWNGANRATVRNVARARLPETEANLADLDAVAGLPRELIDACEHAGRGRLSARRPIQATTNAVYPSVVKK